MEWFKFLGVMSVSPIMSEPSIAWQDSGIGVRKCCGGW